jgi:hypothetical protein
MMFRLDDMPFKLDIKVGGPGKMLDGLEPQSAQTASQQDDCDEESSTARQR